MNEQINDNQRDDDKISSLYKQGSVETPSNRVNKTIQHHARSHSNNVIALPLRQLFNIICSSRTLAVAAVLVISVSIILQIQFDHPSELVPATPEQLLEEQLFSNSEPDNISIESSRTPSPSSNEVKSELAPVIDNIPAPVKESPSIANEGAIAPIQKKSKQAHPKPSLNLMAPEKRRAHEEIRKQRLKNLQQKKQRSMKEKDSFERARKVQRSEVHSQEISKIDSLPVENCPLLNNRACISSLNCSLITVDDALVCNDASNICDKDFSQLLGTQNQCELKESCEFIAGQCECNSDAEGSCSCLDNRPPSCGFIPEGDEDKEED